MQDEKEVQRKAIEEYGEEVGLIYMVGYIRGKLDGIKDAMETEKNFSLKDIFAP